MELVKWNSFVHRFSILTVFVTLCLIGVGGIVTSTESGMTVPDWPNSYGYNMFLFPISLWKGGIFYEHSHRLVASFVGFLTILLALGLQFSKSTDRTTKMLGWLALVLVILQGVLGGLRVTLIEKQIGIFHAILAQSFFVLLGILAYRTSRIPLRLSPQVSDPHSLRQLGFFFLTFSLLALLQLSLGATMRHQHEGLAVPTFPDAYGQFLPDISQNAIAEINFHREHVEEIHPISTMHIVVHMAHRFLAYFLVIAGTIWTAYAFARRHFSRARIPHILPVGFLIMLWGQVILGIVTVLRNKPADIATLHVVFGACLLLLCSLLAKHCFYCLSACQKVALTSGQYIPQNQPSLDKNPVTSAA